MSGLHTLGRRRLPDGAHRDAVLGSLAEYTWGESQVLQLVQFFDQQGRPAKYEGAVEGIYTSYERLRTSFATLAALTRGEGMRQLGEQAQALQREIQSYLASQGRDVALPPQQPAPPKSSLLPWWGWLLVAGAAVGAVGYFTAPVIIPLVARRRAIAAATS